MDNKKGFSSLLLIGIVAVALVIGGGAYFVMNPSLVMQNTPSQNETPIIETATQPSNSPTGTNYQYVATGNSVSLVSNGKTLQTISAPEDARRLFTGPLFLTDLDINFDGNPDLGVYAAMGSGGSNIFYEFYVYDSKTSKLVKVPELTNGEVGLSNPAVDTQKKQVLSSMRGGSEWTATTFQYNGSGYDRLK